MTKIKNFIMMAIVILMLLCTNVNVSADNPQEEDEPYTFYWVTGQNPGNTTVYIFAKYGADITFSGMNTVPVTVSVKPGVITTYNAAALGYTQAEKEFFYLEMRSSKPIMVCLDRVVTIRRSQTEWEERHVDSIFRKPPMELSSKYYFAFGHSGSADDKLVLYSAEPTTVTVKRIAASGQIFTKSFQIEGLFESPKIQAWLGGPNFGNGIIVTAEKPIAAGLYDENPWWPSSSCGAGYYSGFVGHTKLYDEYMHIHYYENLYATIYTPNSNIISYYDEYNNYVGSRIFYGEASTHPTLNPTGRMFFSDIGYDTTTQPYLVHVVGTTEFADYINTPVATDVTDGAAYIGFNASLASLEIYTDTATEIKVINGINNTMTNFTMEANTIAAKMLVNDLGFAPQQPFLITVISTIPVYQQIRGYFRQYPAAIGPGLEPTIRIEPETLNLNSNGEFTAFIKLPEGFDVADIDISTLICEGAPAVRGNVANDKLVVKFNREDLEGVEPGDEVTFTVTGYFYDGTPIAGWDTIRVIEKGK